MKKGAHTQYDLEVHVVWITKYRRKILKGKISNRLKVLLMQGCTAKGITIVRGNIQSEHVYLQLSIPASLSVSQVMQYIKGKSSKKLQEEFPSLRKQFWGQHMWATGYFCRSVGKHMWATGYFCRSVGKVTQDMIEEYIENQNDNVDDVFKQDSML